MQWPNYNKKFKNKEMKEKSTPLSLWKFYISGHNEKNLVLKLGKMSKNTT